MRVLGLGFRQGATIESLRGALAAAGGAEGLVALATLSEKADADALASLARELGLPVRSVRPEALAGMKTATRSARVEEKFGTGSVAEAAALAAAGRDARLVATRVVSKDGMATAAIAEGEGE
ncbi:cobalamin biosynthesis protein [Bradyrhizobium sp. NP1]|uniref:cobalamin biosynthesis protein n=1 Tax=Bradyrhizobium sp. NP1 TaxID=3049772 RepID=UPI0025A5FE11|nr:cobalamin biosynthesis protein [Bradyrhizobium sp. NP1]WJR76636.1 cobalamin biosynthesis protein [Bradyrhizobium sp. NP1]